MPSDLLDEGHSDPHGEDYFLPDAGEKNRRGQENVDATG